MGAFVCGLIGPAIALALGNLQLHPTSLAEICAIPFVVLREWIFAFASVGPEALVFGAVCGLLLSALLSSHRPASVTLTATAVLGSILGGAVGPMTILVNFLLDSRRPRERVNIFGLVPLGAMTGVVCAFLLLGLLMWVSFRRARVDVYN